MKLSTLILDEFKKLNIESMNSVSTLRKLYEDAIFMEEQVEIANQIKEREEFSYSKIYGEVESVKSKCVHCGKKRLEYLRKYVNPEILPHTSKSYDMLRCDNCERIQITKKVSTN